MATMANGRVSPGHVPDCFLFHFPVVSWVSLWSEIVAFPGHSRLLFAYYL